MLKIERWSPLYQDQLKQMISAFFQASLDRGGDLLNTPRNIDVYYNLGIRKAAEGDPCLIALSDGVPVAYVMWTGAPDVVDTKHKTINAIGSYTTPTHRNKLVATALREEALRITRERGYTKIVGPVQLNNARGVREFCETYGAWPTSVNFEFEVP